MSGYDRISISGSQHERDHEYEVHWHSNQVAEEGASSEADGSAIKATKQFTKNNDAARTRTTNPIDQDKVSTQDRRQRKQEHPQHFGSKLRRCPVAHSGNIVVTTMACRDEHVASEASVASKAINRGNEERIVLCGQVG